MVTRINSSLSASTSSESSPVHGKVLVVDDTPINLELLVAAVEELGHEVVQASNGQQALAAAAGDDIDLVLLDYLLPDMSGLQVLHRLREQQCALELPVIIVTAFYETSVVVEALQAGANDYIHKPFDFEVLKARIDVQLQRKQLDAQLRATMDAAERANLAKSDFLTMVSHELRTPLNAILGFCQLIEHDIKEAGEDKYLTDLENIYSSGRRMLTLTEGLLDLARIEAGKMEFSYSQFSLAKLLHSCIEELRPLFLENGNRLEVHSETDFDVFHGDELRLRQILVNLLGNAAKYANNGRIVVKLKKQGLSVKEPVYACIEIKDSGMGIPADKLDMMFKKFSRLHNGKGEIAKGAGLGLMISHQLCASMGGSIAVESQKGQGSTFTVLIPDAVKQSGFGAALLPA